MLRDRYQIYWKQWASSTAQSGVTGRWIIGPVLDSELAAAFLREETPSPDPANPEIQNLWRAYQGLAQSDANGDDPELMCPATTTQCTNHPTGTIQTSDRFAEYTLLCPDSSCPVDNFGPCLNEEVGLCQNYVGTSFLAMPPNSVLCADTVDHCDVEVSGFPARVAYNETQREQLTVINGAYVRRSDLGLHNRRSVWFNAAAGVDGSGMCVLLPPPPPSAAMVTQQRSAQSAGAFSPNGPRFVICHLPRAHARPAR